MNYKNYFFAGALAVIFAACTGNDDNPITPKPEDNPAINELLTDFVKTVPGIEKYQQTQADYSKTGNWMVAETRARTSSPYPRGSWSRRWKWPDVFYAGLCGESQYSVFLAFFMRFLC